MNGDLWFAVVVLLIIAALKMFAPSAADECQFVLLGAATGWGLKGLYGVIKKRKK